MKRCYSLSSLLLLVGIVGGLSLSSQATAQVNLGAGLTGAQISGVRPHGHAYYHSKNGNSLFDIAVENVNLPDNTTLNVDDNGTPFTTIVLVGGAAVWHLNSSLGDVIPAIQSGDTLSVTDSNGNTLLSGTMHMPVPTMHLIAALTGASMGSETPSGTAAYSTSKVVQKFVMKVANVNLIDGTVLTVNDNGVAFGTMTLKKGKAKLSLNTQNGDTIPVMQDGDVLTVTLDNGNVILVGELGMPMRMKHTVGFNTRLTGSDIGSVQPFGYAHFEMNLNNNARHFGSGALNVNLTDGTAVTFNWNGNALATLTLRQGRAFLSLDTEDGDNTPTMQAGDTITVTDSNGNVLLSGTLG